MIEQRSDLGELASIEHEYVTVQTGGSGTNGFIVKIALGESPV